MSASGENCSATHSDRDNMGLWLMRKSASWLSNWACIVPSCLQNINAATIARRAAITVPMPVIMVQHGAGLAISLLSLLFLTAFSCGCSAD